VPGVTRILLINPPEDVAQALGASPLLEGVTIDTAASDAEALRWLRIRAYDVVLSNPATPVQDDLVFLEEARLARPGVRPIVLTDGAAPEEVIAALRSRVFAFFSAPWDLPELSDMVTRAVAATDWHEGIEVVSARPDWISLRVNCGLLTVERLVRFLFELGKDLPEDDRDEVMLAFREILVNAMEHGGEFNPAQVVEVSAVRTKRTIVYYVKDPGPGFDPGRLPHAASSEAEMEEDLLAHAEQRAQLGLRPGGFGLLLARKIADEMIYNEQGNEVLLIKHIV
jgi:anti-sigma regulatory factor (Ser/Thr protein kinase)/CheY-like chemotaxis protein